jgi:hypothetical protein
MIKMEGCEAEVINHGIQARESSEKEIGELQDRKGGCGH